MVAALRESGLLVLGLLVASQCRPLVVNYVMFLQSYLMRKLSFIKEAAAGFIFLGLASISLGWSFVRLLDCGTYKNGKGLVATATVDEFDHGNFKTYRPKVTCFFQVDNSEYKCERWSAFAGLLEFPCTKAEAEALISPFPVGGKCDVYFSADDPAANFLVKEVAWQVWSAIAMLATVALFCTYRISNLWRRRQE